MWARWRAFVGQDADVRPLALVRILVCAVVLADLGGVARLDLVTFLFRTYDAGGLSVAQDDAGLLTAISAQWAGPAAFGVAAVAFVLAGVGVGTRTALLVGIVAWAQLGHLYPPGDRAIDRLVRTAMLVLVFSGSHLRFALTGPRADRTSAWAADTLRLLLVIVYLSAGIGKLQQQPGWIGWPEFPVLYRVMADPLAARLDPVEALAWTPLFRVLGFGTIALELSSPLIFTRLARTWAIFGIAMHVGIALTMNLGMFSWGVLALYPVLLFPRRLAS